LYFSCAVTVKLNLPSQQTSSLHTSWFQSFYYNKLLLFLKIIYYITTETLLLINDLFRFTLSNWRTLTWNFETLEIIFALNQIFLFFFLLCNICLIQIKLKKIPVYTKDIYITFPLFFSSQKYINGTQCQFMPTSLDLSYIDKGDKFQILQ